MAVKPAGAALQRSETLLWASGAALGLVDDDCLGLEAEFGPVSQVAQCHLSGGHGKHLLKDESRCTVCRLDTED